MAARIRANIAESQAARAASSFEEFSRYETAYNFYRSGNWSADATLNHLRGIDFSMPVEVTTLPEGSIIGQQVVGGRIGNYFSPAGTPATELGIDPAGRGTILFQTNADVTVLRSTAATIPDWGGERVEYSLAVVRSTSHTRLGTLWWCHGNESA
jgi:hypothetical protein